MTCTHNQVRDRNSLFCHSCYMQKWRKRNKDHLNKKQREWYSKRNKQNPELEKEKRKEAQLKYKYNISKDDYDSLLVKFDYKCALCNNSNNLCIDHDHSTGQIRGILCKACNSALGRLGDTQESLEKVLKYLKE